MADAAGFVERTRVLPMVHRGTAIPVDMVLAGPGLEELFLSRRGVIPRERSMALSTHEILRGDARGGAVERLGLEDIAAKLEIASLLPA